VRKGKEEKQIVKNAQKARLLIGNGHIRVVADSKKNSFL
jgi:hypothetical protein